MVIHIDVNHFNYYTMNAIYIFLWSKIFSFCKQACLFSCDVTINLFQFAKMNKKYKTNLVWNKCTFSQLKWKTFSCTTHSDFYLFTVLNPQFHTVASILNSRVNNQRHTQHCTKTVFFLSLLNLITHHLFERTEQSWSEEKKSSFLALSWKE